MCINSLGFTKIYLIEKHIEHIILEKNRKNKQEREREVPIYFLLTRLTVYFLLTGEFNITPTKMFSRNQRGKIRTTIYIKYNQIEM